MIREWRKFGAVALLALLTAVVTGTLSSHTSLAASTSISPQPSGTLVPLDGWNDSGVTLKESMLASLSDTEVLISDQRLLRIGWTIKVDSELMLIEGLTEGGTNDVMTVRRARGGTPATSHGNGAIIQAHSITFEVWAMDVIDPDGVGGFAVYLTLPPEVQYVKMSSKTTWLASTGRDPWCFGPTQIDSDTWEVHCATMGNPGSPGYPLGPTGSGLIAKVTLLPPSQEGISQISLAGSYLLDVPGHEIPSLAKNTFIRVVGCADVNLDGYIDITDTFITARQWNDAGVDCGVQLVANAQATQGQDTLMINDQDIAWWASFECTSAGNPSAQRPDTIAIGAEQMNVLEFVEGGETDSVLVNRPAPYTQSFAHNSGDTVYLTPSEWDGNYDGRNGYTPTRDVDHDGYITITDTFITVKAWGMQCE